MNAYIIYDEQQRVVAYTDDKEILEKYLFNIEKTTHKKYSFKKIKYKHIKNISEYDDLYLIRYGDTYIPNKYYKYMELCDTKEETRQVIDYLIRQLEQRELRDKKRKLVEKMILLIEKWYEEEKEYTPTNEELQNIEDHYKPYIEKWYD